MGVANVSRWTPVLFMLLGVCVFWLRPVVGTLREFRREQRRAKWDARREWRRSMDGFGPRR